MIDLGIGTHVQVGVRQLAKEFGPPDTASSRPTFSRQGRRTDDGRRLGASPQPEPREHLLCVSGRGARDGGVEPREDGKRGQLVALLGTKPDGGAVYRASKAAAAALVEELAADWQRDGIAVSGVKFLDDGDEGTYRWVGDAVLSLCD